MRTACYIDGFNLYHGIDKLEKPHLKWLNLRSLAQSLLEPEDTLAKVAYFTSPSRWKPVKRKRHIEYIKALEAVGVENHLSQFDKVDKYCLEQKRYCVFYEEKRSDVAFAVTVLHDAHNSVFEKAILVTADSDQIPLINVIKADFAHITVLVATPPGRWQIARQIRNTADDSIKITAGRLERCLFPRDVVNRRGVVVARAPASYSPIRGWQ